MHTQKRGIYVLNNHTTNAVSVAEHEQRNNSKDSVVLGHLIRTDHTILVKLAQENIMFAQNINSSLTDVIHDQRPNTQ